MAAVLSYDTTTSDGKLGAWMRYRIAKDANETAQASPVFQSVGEVAIYKKKTQ
jgi:hypothetical protein